MARPLKQRIICQNQKSRKFETGNGAPCIALAMDELEALRLTDLEELDQETASVHMGISRGTLQRLLYSGRRKLTFALIIGRSITITGGESTRQCCPARKQCRFCLKKFNPIKKSGARKMKIAITSENDQVFQHFGRTPEFTVFEIENKKIKEMKKEPTGETGHGALAGFLADRKIDILICGGIGEGAQIALAESGIKLVAGTQGCVTQIIEDYLKGNLSNNSNFTCNHHHHDHNTENSCGDHGCGNGHSCSH